MRRQRQRPLRESPQARENLEKKALNRRPLRRSRTRRRRPRRPPGGGPGARPHPVRGRQEAQGRSGRCVDAARVRRGPRGGKIEGAPGRGLVSVSRAIRSGERRRDRGDAAEGLRGGDGSRGGRGEREGSRGNGRSAESRDGRESEREHRRQRSRRGSGDRRENRRGDRGKTRHLSRRGAGARKREHESEKRELSPQDQWHCTDRGSSSSQTKDPPDRRQRSYMGIGSGIARFRF